MDPRLRFNLRPMVLNGKGSKAPRVFVRSTSLLNSPYSSSRAPFNSYGSNFGINPNIIQNLNTQIALNYLETPHIENRTSNYPNSENGIFPQTSTESYIYALNHHDDNAPTYRSEIYLNPNASKSKDYLKFNNNNLSDVTTLAESTISSNSISEAENISFSAQKELQTPNESKKNSSDHYKKADLNDLFDFLQTDSEPKKAPIFEESQPEYISADLGNKTLTKEIFDPMQLAGSNISLTTNETNEHNPVKTEIGTKAPPERELPESRNENQGCMEICITPPSTTELITSNDFYLPDPNLDAEDNNTSNFRTFNNSRIKNQTPENSTKESPKLVQNLREYKKKGSTLSSICPKLLNCLFPWMLSEDYFEEVEGPTIPHAKEIEEARILLSN
ncbi:hypothetical protein HWI79_3662 [Cryptosporidium felis]|nr:hypothetical protein HWI79_3662 [Cryptosporidium felis]